VESEDFGGSDAYGYVYSDAIYEIKKLMRVRGKERKSIYIVPFWPRRYTQRVQQQIAAIQF